MTVPVPTGPVAPVIQSPIQDWVYGVRTPGSVQQGFFNIGYNSTARGNNYNYSTGIYTAPFNGILIIDAAVTVSAVPSGGYGQLYVISSNQTEGNFCYGPYCGSGSVVTMNVSTSFLVVAGDQIRIQTNIAVGNPMIGCTIYSSSQSWATFALFPTVSGAPTLTTSYSLDSENQSTEASD